MVTSSLPLMPPEASPLNGQALEDCIDWLSFHRVWGALSPKAIAAIAHSLQILHTQAQIEIYQEKTILQGLYFLKWGTVEIYRHSTIGKTHIIYRNAGDIFGYLPLFNNSNPCISTTSAITITPCELWFLGRESLENLQTNYPDIQSAFNRLLALDLDHFSQRLAKEQARIQGLQPYLKPVTGDEKIIGISKAAQKLRQQVEQLKTSIEPIILQAPPGSGKTFIAGFIHAQSALKNHPFAEIDLGELPQLENGSIDTDALFGRFNGQPGILELLERGTLLIDRVNLLNPSEKARLIHYLKTGEIIPNCDPTQLNLSSEIPPAKLSWVRLILASPEKRSGLQIEATSLKLLSLPQRKQDITEFAQYFLEKYCRERGRTPLELNPAERRRLLSYNYPENLSELSNILKRAVMMTPPEQTIIPEQVLWSVESKKNAFRVDLLNEIPGLRQFLLSDWWPKRVWWLMMAIFIPVTVMGFIGPQTRESSVTLNLFWAWWWPFYLLLFPIIGRLWCAVCPFMIVGEALRKLSLLLFPRKQFSWPTKWLNQWGAWLLWGGFVVIYLWEKLWDLPHRAYLSSWLLVAITAGAIICSLIYERRLWCRYLCPIGGMNGMFAKLGMIELRSTQQVCGSQCNTFGCYKGGEITPVSFANALPTEGQATGGCPLYSHPAQLSDNRDCVFCMSCLKACPNRSVQLNFRFPAADLWENHQGFAAEVALLLLLFGGVFMHHSQKILSWVSLGDLPIDSEHLLWSLPIVLGLLSVPAMATYGAHKLARVFDGEMPDYSTVIYAYLPMVLAINLVCYIPAAIGEAGRILPVIARTFGYSGIGLFSLTWSQDVAAFLQGVTLLSILVLSVFPLLKITQRSWLNNLPHIGLMIVLIGICFRLMV
ncbi:cyclic nucleotide-binding domain-containing protein [Capilliphycus salinus ALCB114379]|uniref:cyclic nucleotide-binding domain-containing protein n=1 Tax=Capilliphycus salinus TaxID=2768948 RepID=UPI0039A595F8